MPNQAVAEVVALTPKPVTTHVFVSPDMARRWLANNKVNRNLRPRKVEQYVSDMQNGRWTFSNDSICFAPDGTLLNGQHRLSAVVKADVSVLLSITRNMPTEAMTRMDQGAARTVGDVLKFRGEASYTSLAAAARLAILCRDGITKGGALPTAAATEAFIAENPSIRDSVAASLTVKMHTDAAPSAVAVAHWLISLKAGVGPAGFFVDQLGSRAQEPEGSAVLAIDSRLRQIRRNGTRVQSRNIVALLIKGWNHYANDTRVASLSLPTDGRIPTPRKWAR